jgi:hypothetical protein
LNHRPRAYESPALPLSYSAANPRLPSAMNRGKRHIHCTYLSDSTSPIRATTRRSTTPAAQDRAMRDRKSSDSARPSPVTAAPQPETDSSRYRRCPVVSRTWRRWSLRSRGVAPFARAGARRFVCGCSRQRTTSGAGRGGPIKSNAKGVLTVDPSSLVIQSAQFTARW